MSTRALYTFKGEPNSGSPHDFNVYKHHDGYPSGALLALQNAMKNAWELPRYESDEFAAAFCAANKSTGGGVRLMPQGDAEAVADRNCSDIAYRYEIWLGSKNLMVRCVDIGNGEIFEGSLKQFAHWVKVKEKENN